MSRQRKKVTMTAWHMAAASRCHDNCFYSTVPRTHTHSENKKPNLWMLEANINKRGNLHEPNANGTTDRIRKTRFFPPHHYRGSVCSSLLDGWTNRWMWTSSLVRMQGTTKCSSCFTGLCVCVHVRVCVRVERVTASNTHRWPSIRWGKRREKKKSKVFNLTLTYVQLKRK